MPTLQEQLNELLAEPLQDADLQKELLQTVLQNVQGNILHAHGRDFAIHIFLRFQDGQQANVKKWLRDHIVCKVTSARDQLTERQSKPKERANLFVSCFLSASGYSFFKWCNPATKFSVEFAGGMKEARKRLQDPPYVSWEENYRQAIHAMILLAHHDEKTLLDAAQKLVNDIPPSTAAHWCERGSVLRKYKQSDGHSYGPRVEHFGYVDGHSQPLFFQQDLVKEEQERGIDRWDPSAGPRLVLTPDPLGGETDYGSYLVFRKLEQDVDGFNQQIKLLADALGVDQDKAKALVIGRSPQGTPLVPHNTPIAYQNPETNVPNNFRYNEDPDGQLCPYHAHIRRMNPRWDAGDLKYDRRIARRSIPYGPKGITKSVGILFICYQQCLKRQFEALQGLWAHAPDESAFSKTGDDPLIGTLEKGTISRHRWPSPAGTLDVEISNFVSLQGGEYFFAPSINVLQRLLGIL